MHPSLTASKAAPRPPGSHDFHTLAIGVVSNFRGATTCDKKHTLWLSPFPGAGFPMHHIKKMLPTSDYENVPGSTALGKAQKIC